MEAGRGLPIPTLPSRLICSSFWASTAMCPPPAPPIRGERVSIYSIIFFHFTFLSLFSSPNRGRPGGGFLTYTSLQTDLQQLLSFDCNMPPSCSPQKGERVCIYSIIFFIFLFCLCSPPPIGGGREGASYPTLPSRLICSSFWASTAVCPPPAPPKRGRE